ncbi:uncharacterized protein UTRI_03727_B [Ustilago trichophora]|uniref:Nucleolar 27S pre-rRNA processing Urb2/Npa2 C-terminal domain-containing protein n=1 Tax=Ustilago trichophora TaxID=86804 RepID=A0A5C3E2C7_9BASI|nr:uncharacterized protein UTRI_03727_B [Ustilago trichophora]
MPTATRSRAAAAGPSEPSSNTTSPLASASITTSEQLVKALRVPQPPSNGVSKLDIALDAWHSASFFVPKKAELLSQWVLEHLCSSLKTSSSISAPGTPNKNKNKSKQQQAVLSTVTSELDLKAWQLLFAIVTAQISIDSELSEAAKRSWLSHLANTQPLLSLAGAFARQLIQARNLTLKDREALLSAASVSLAKLLPPATSRTAATNIEAATDSIQAWLDFFGQSRSTVEQQAGHAILNSIVDTWTITLQYGSNAKRNHQQFCNAAVPSLLRALHTLSSRTADANATIMESLPLLQVVKQVAADSLFNEDVQRSLLQAGRSAEVTRTASWKETKTATSGIAAQLTSLLQEAQLNEAVLSSLATLSDLLYTKLNRSEALNSIASSSTTTSGSVRETQLSLVRKTMLCQWYIPLLPFLVTSSGPEAQQAQRAAARKGLLQCIERNGLYVIGCDEHEEWRSLFVTLFDSTRTELRQIAAEPVSTAQSEIADHFACLTSLWRLEKSVVEGDLVSIFALVAAQRVSKQALWLTEELPASTLAALDFFRAVATIDMRFRTIPGLISAVLGSIPLTAELIAKTKDNALSSSLVTSQTFLAELGKLCRDNVTPMQVPDLIQRLTGLADCLESVSSSITATPRSKRQRTASTDPTKSNTHGQIAPALIAQLQIAAQIVQSVNLASNLRARSIAAAEELHNALVLPCLDLCLVSTSTAPAPATCGVAAAALRVRQALLSEKWRYDPSEPVKLDGSLPTESLPCLEAAFDERSDSLRELLSLGESSPELCQLKFQILQSFLQRAERDTFLDKTDSQYCQLLSKDMGAVFELLKDMSTTASSDLKASISDWNGCPNRIRDGSELLQVVWMAVVTRWAPLFESIAGNVTLEMLADTLVTLAEPSEDGEEGGMRYVTSTALRNASFLELPKWREQTMVHIIKRLGNGENLKRRLAVTAALWVTPAEWVSRNIRPIVLRHLLSLDEDLVSAHKKEAVSEGILDRWTQLRNLLTRVLQEYAAESHNKDEDLCASLQGYLAASSNSHKDGEVQHAWEQASLSALQATVRVLLVRSKQNVSTQTRLVEVVKQIRQEAATEKSKQAGITLKMRAAQDMLATLVGEVAQEGDTAALTQNLEAIKSLTSEKLVTASEVAQKLDVALYHLREVRLAIHGGAGAGGAEYQALMATLTKDVVASLCVVFSRASVVGGPEAGEDSTKQKLCKPAAIVAFELIRCIDACGRAVSMEAGKASSLAVCVAYSALIASLPGLQEQRRVVDGLQRIVSHLEGEVYDGVLCQLLAALRSTVTASDSEAASENQVAAIDGDAAALISTIGLVLGSAPEGTSKIARTHVSHWLSILSSTNMCGGRIKLRSMVASVLALDSLCSNHAMLFRTQDMGATLQLFATITGPSMLDEPSCSILVLTCSELDTMRTKLFDGVVSTLGSLMRLRQDLVLSFLPHLGSLLARLCTLFRRLRRTHTSTRSRIEASGTQRRALRRDLPAWLDPELVTPLTAAHSARALSRLLSSLVVKNVSLKARSSELAKAESLARPFSKHATYILVAYLKSLTAQNSIVPAEVRAELEVGMMTICEVIGQRQRDAAMDGLLDSAGKVLLKRIWGEFEKQRYRGQ